MVAIHPVSAFSPVSLAPSLYPLGTLALEQKIKNSNKTKNVVIEYCSIANTVVMHCSKGAGSYMATEVQISGLVDLNTRGTRLGIHDLMSWCPGGRGL